MDASMTYKELNQAINLFSTGLQQLGVKPGDRVTVMLPNCPQFIIAAYAIWRLGGILVCGNPLFVEREIEYLLNDSESETIVVMSAYFERVQAVRAKTNLKRVIDLARTAWAADLLANPGYSVTDVARILGYSSPGHLAGSAQRVAGATARELARLGPRGVLNRFIRGRTRSRV